MSQHQHVEHVFRHEYGKLVASLLRRVGVLHLEAVEDAVQEAMMKAIENWSKNVIPDNPSAWLYTVAYRLLITEIRNLKNRRELLSAQFDPQPNQFVEQTEIPLPGEMSDSLLRMLFVTCNNAIPDESQLVFTLKCLCGFSVKEIALRLFISEANVYKRFGRARKVLQNDAIELDAMTDREMTSRLPMVHNILYLLFTEGHLSSQTDSAIVKDMCEQAIHLTTIIHKSSLQNNPETSALLALMYFHLSRIDAREDESGALLLLEHQDRKKWNQEMIRTGIFYLENSANGNTLSRYHIEANIAAEHCLAPSFKQTRWDRIVRSYELLEDFTPTVLHHLNWAIALSEWQGADVALKALKSKDIPVWLERSYHWYAVLADLQYRCGEHETARDSAELALQAAPTQSIKNLLFTRLAKYNFELHAP